jgi:allantoin racemase
LTSAEESAMARRLLVINPNSSEAVTRGIDRAMAPLRVDQPTIIDVVRLPAGPPGIESQQDVESVVPLIIRRIRESNDADGYVIACFSDPGIHAAREATNRPVFGVAECGILTALTLGARFGMISILQRVIPRHMRFLGAMGVESRCAGDRAIGLKVSELADEKTTFARMLETGTDLRDKDGADVAIMACAGMAQYRPRLAEALGIPVVEPSQAAVAMALGRISLGW